MESRRYGIGAETTATSATRFRVWAPRRSRVEVILEAPGRALLDMVQHVLPMAKGR